MSGKIYCGRLAPTCTEKNLEDLVKAFGKVREVDFREGFAYVVFKEAKDADKAVQALNNTHFLGQSILVERAKEARNGVGGYTVAGGFTARTKQMGPPTRSEFRVRVENLSTRAKWLELKEFMNTAGEVCFADTHRRRPGEGVVEFTTEEDMKRAIQGLDKKEFYGRKIRIIEETPKTKPSLSRSRSRSPSRSDIRRQRRSTSGSRRRRSLSRSPRRERSGSRSRVKKQRSRSRSRRSRSKNKRKSRSRSKSLSRSRSRSGSRSK
ncbi:Serine/arginine-rich splicing factor 4, partial [Exaiptasia diaphana]